MKKFLTKFFTALILLGVVVGCTKKVLNKEVDSVPELTLDELDQKIAAQEDIVVLFTWKEKCGDSVKFQENYLEAKLAENPSWKSKFMMINLDKEMPEALMNRELRKPLMDKYGIDTSPALVHFGKEVNRVFWTPRDNDEKYAIAKEVLDEFFDGIE